MTRADRRYRLGDLVLDTRTQRVRVRGRHIALTRPQLAILRALFEAAGATLSREDILARIGSVGAGASARAVDLQVSRLRRRLGDHSDAPRYVEAVYGSGYRLVPERADPSDGRYADAVLEALPEPVLLLDERLIVRDVNPAAEGLLGRPREHLLGLPCGLVTDCRDCGGGSMSGARCLGRAALQGEAHPLEVRGTVGGVAGAVPVVFTHVHVLPDPEVRLVAVSLHRDPRSTGAGPALRRP